MNKGSLSMVGMVLLFMLVVGAAAGVPTESAEPLVLDPELNMTAIASPVEPVEEIQCDFCSQPACGCPMVPEGCTLAFECSCSSIWCSRTCTPHC